MDNQEIKKLNGTREIRNRWEEGGIKNWWKRTRLEHHYRFLKTMLVRLKKGKIPRFFEKDAYLETCRQLIEQRIEKMRQIDAESRLIQEILDELNNLTDFHPPPK